MELIGPLYNEMNKLSKLLVDGKILVTEIIYTSLKNTAKYAFEHQKTNQVINKKKKKQ